MPFVIIGNVISLAQAKLGDENGELFTTNMLLTHAISAYADLYRLLMNIASPRARRVRYIRIPANTSSFTFDYNNMAPNWESGVEVADRMENSSVTIAALANSNTDNILVTTSAPHGLTVGNMAALIGTGWRWLDGLHAVTTVPTSTTFTVRGTLAVGSSVAGTAIVSVATQGFQRVDVTDLIRQWPTTPAARIDQIAYTENEMQFWPCNNTRQMRLMYDCSGDDIASSNDLVGMDGAFDFLAVVTAAYAAHAKGATTKYEELSNLAFGSRSNGDWNRTRPDGGLARALLSSHVRTLQQQQWPRPPWRQRKLPTSSAFPIG